jgi:hypothetical protein
VPLGDAHVGTDCATHSDRAEPASVPLGKSQAATLAERLGQGDNHGPVAPDSGHVAMGEVASGRSARALGRDGEDELNLVDLGMGG